MKDLHKHILLDKNDNQNAKQKRDTAHVQYQDVLTQVI